MRINFHGAAQTVTGSQHLLEINGHRLLLDCGLYQGKRSETYERNLNFAHDPHKLDAVLLSHAHIDHAGNLPNLVQDGYEGPIFATRATVDLATIMLADSGRIQESDAAFLNKKRLERGEAAIEPLYTEADAQWAAQFFRGAGRGAQEEPELPEGGSLRLRHLPAGPPGDGHPRRTRSRPRCATRSSPSCPAVR